MVNGTNVYDYAMNIESIGLDTPISGYSFRSAGSRGANATANWILNQFQVMGLADAHLEPFDFATWDVRTPPLLVIDHDGNQSTTVDQVTVHSFEPEQFSWPTSEEGMFGEIVTLPLPAARDRNSLASITQYDASAWNTTNIMGKILLIGREVRWNGGLSSVLLTKLKQQPPLAIIYAWSYDWMSWAPPSFSSAGGRPASSSGSYYWDLNITVGWVSYQDGLQIRQELGLSRLYASVTVNAEIGSGPHYNVVAMLPGSVDDGKMILITGHYDSVMDPGLCDNAAGTAGVIELARVFEQAARDNIYQPPYELVFVAFASEELGSVGAVRYLKQHADKLGNIVALINLDCIGGKTLEITETFTDDRGLNLQDIVRNACSDLNVSLRIVEPGGSDQEAFRNPVATDDLYQLFWQTSSGIRNMTRVKSSVGFESYPLFITDVSEGGIPGWIHTSYDNSTTVSWVDVANLQRHVQVAALTVLRVLSTSVNPISMEVYGVIVISVVLISVFLLIKRTRVIMLLRRSGHHVLSYLGFKHVFYILLLTIFSLFMSYFLFMRLGRVEIVVNGYPTPVDILIYGAPLDMFGIVSSMSSLPQSLGNIIPFWQGMLLDILIYAVIAFALIYTVERIRTAFEHSRHTRQED